MAAPSEPPSPQGLRRKGTGRLRPQEGQAARPGVPTASSARPPPASPPWSLGRTGTASSVTARTSHRSHLQSPKPGPPEAEPGPLPAAGPPALAAWVGASALQSLPAPRPDPLGLVTVHLSGSPQHPWVAKAGPRGEGAGTAFTAGCYLNARAQGMGQGWGHRPGPVRWPMSGPRGRATPGLGAGSTEPGEQAQQPSSQTLRRGGGPLASGGGEGPRAMPSGLRTQLLTPCSPGSSPPSGDTQRPTPGDPGHLPAALGSPPGRPRGQRGHCPPPPSPQSRPGQARAHEGPGQREPLTATPHVGLTADTLLVAGDPSPLMTLTSCAG